MISVSRQGQIPPQAAAHGTPWTLPIARSPPRPRNPVSFPLFSSVWLVWLVWLSAQVSATPSKFVLDDMELVILKPRS